MFFVPWTSAAMRAGERLRAEAAYDLRDPPMRRPADRARLERDPAGWLADRGPGVILLERFRGPLRKILQALRAEAVRRVEDLLQVPGRVEEVLARAEQVRQQMKVALGLWPMPAKTPLNAVIHGKIERDEYTVEKVYFESAPGFFVTGNLYRPKAKPGKAPVVLFAHGHWKDARLAEAS